MVINKVIVSLQETKLLVEYLQKEIQQNPRKGFWLLSATTFVVAPFLTNDGVCLLFVEIILKAFEGLDTVVKDTTAVSNSAIENEETVNPLATEEGKENVPAIRGADALEIGEIKPQSIVVSKHKNNLVKEDALYFLLTLACSSNIGSALTYTGNPQNMIVAQGAADVLPPGKFLLWMILPTLITWIITTLWIEWCWTASKKPSNSISFQHIFKRRIRVKFSNSQTAQNNDDGATGKLLQHNRNLSGITPDCSISLEAVGGTQEKIVSPMSPRRRARMERESRKEKVLNFISSPIPYVAIIIMIAMIVMIFVDIMSITSLVCVTAMLMITVLVFSNHWRGISIWGLLATSEFAAVPLTAQDRLDDLNEFFEELFSSIDYSILLIFLGTFVVIANIESTGIPKRLWDKIVGEVPFSTVGSVFGISLFVMISSQLLGNVAIVQLSRPNVDVLEDDSRAYAWAVISFVSTIAGNLTITGSAANIIVAEKAARIDPEANINFFQHYRVCFWVTAVSCAIGASLITAISKIH